MEETVKEEASQEALETVYQSPGAEDCIRGDRQDSWRILQENITEVQALKAVQEVPAGFAGLLFLSKRHDRRQEEQR